MKQPDYFNAPPVPEVSRNNLIDNLTFTEVIAPYFQDRDWELLADMYKHMKMVHDGECGEMGSALYCNTKYHVADSFWRWIVPLMQSIEDSQEIPEEESEEEPEEVHLG